MKKNSQSRSKTSQPFVGVIETWTEYERGWGSRPDGVSLHFAGIDNKNFVEKFIADRKAKYGKSVPDEYSSNDGNVTAVYISESLYERLEDAKEDFGIWLSQIEFLKLYKLGEIKKII